MKRTLVGLALTLTFALGGCSLGTEDDIVAPVAMPTVSTTSAEVETPAVAPSVAAPVPAPAPAPAPVPAPAPAQASAGTAQAALANLPVAGRADSSNYDRALFGSAWEDVDFNGCDTRNDILARDLSSITTEPNGCIVLTGTLVDPFSGETISFARSSGNGGGVDIDHLVPLSLGWQTGAQNLSVEARTAFANDPLNLLAVDAGLNRQKGDASADEWMPPRSDFHCVYVARQIAVKAKYGMWVTQSEKAAMDNVLSTCPNQPLPADDGSVDVPAGGAAPVAPPPPPPPAPAPAGQGGNDPDFGSCKEAQANGYGPYTKGVDPEYGFYRDGDSDGTVCE